jgi:hypothetical protein
MPELVADGPRCSSRRITFDVRAANGFLHDDVLLVKWSMGRGGASKIRQLILLLSVGWLHPYLHPSGACLYLGSSVLY